MAAPDLERYLAEDWIPALKLGAKISEENLLQPVIEVELGGVPVGGAGTINFIGGSAVDMGNNVINYTPPGGGSSVSTSFQILATDPLIPANGDVWYNSTDEKFRFYEDGAVIELGTGTAGTATGFQLLATDPLTPADGDVWYNTTDNVFRFYQNGNVVEIGTGGSGTATDFQILAADPGVPVDGDVWYNSTDNKFRFFQNGVVAELGAVGAGDTVTIAGDVIYNNTSSVTNQAGSTTVYEDNSIITNNATETYGADYEGVYSSGSTINLESGSQTTYEDGSLITNESTETFGAGYQATFQPGASIDFTNATVTGLSALAPNTLIWPYFGIASSGTPTYIDSDTYTFGINTTTLTTKIPGQAAQTRTISTDVANFDRVDGSFLVGTSLYLYCYRTNPNAAQVIMYDITNIALGGTICSFVGATVPVFNVSTQYMIFDGTHAYVGRNAGNSADNHQFAKYLVSGTTFTYVTTITCGAVSLDGFVNGRLFANSLGEIYSLGVSSDNGQITKFDATGAQLYQDAVGFSTGPIVINYANELFYRLNDGTSDLFVRYDYL
jgi:hypothetical protein